MFSRAVSSDPSNPAILSNYAMFLGAFDSSALLTYLHSWVRQITALPFHPDEVLGDADAAGRALDMALQAQPSAPLLLHNRAALLTAGPRPIDPALLNRAEALYERVGLRSVPAACARDFLNARTGQRNPTPGQNPRNGIRRISRAGDANVREKCAHVCLRPLSLAPLPPTYAHAVVCPQVSEGARSAVILTG